jgi:hypothetical protein
VAHKALEASGKAMLEGMDPLLLAKKIEILTLLYEFF